MFLKVVYTIEWNSLFYLNFCLLFTNTFFNWNFFCKIIDELLPKIWSKCQRNNRHNCRVKASNFWKYGRKWNKINLLDICLIIEVNIYFYALIELTKVILLCFDNWFISKGFINILNILEYKTWKIFILGRVIRINVE